MNKYSSPHTVLRHGMLSTSMLVTPVMAAGLLLLSPGPAMAACTATAGTPAIPAAGATVTCDSLSTWLARIGNNTTQATVNLLDNAIVDTTASNQSGVFLVNPTVTLGTNAQIIAGAGALSYGVRSTGGSNVTLGAGALINGYYGGILNSGAGSTATVTMGAGSVINGGHYGIRSSAKANVTMGANSQINVTGHSYYGTYYAGIKTGSGDSVVTMGDGAIINSTEYGIKGTVGNTKTLTVTTGIGSQINAGATGIRSYLGNSVVTLGAGSEINAGDRGIYTKYSGNITLDAGAKIHAVNAGVANGISATANTTLNVGSGAEIVSSSSWGVFGSYGGGGGVDTFTISGLVQGAAGSMSLRGGNDSLTLRAGADLVGGVNGGLGTDTVTLLDSNAENENFTNFENLVMNGTAWTLSGTSNFSTATTINSGTLTNSGSLTSPVTVNNTGTFSNTGTHSGIVSVANGGTFANTATQTGAVTVAAGGAVSNSAPATITGDVTLGSGVSFDNLGTVVGDIIADAGSFFTNSNILTGGIDTENGAAITLADGATMNAGARNGIYTPDGITVTMGAGAQLNADASGVYSSMGNIDLTMGAGASITAGLTGVNSFFGDTTITLGNNAEINAGTYGVYGKYNNNVTLGSGAKIHSAYDGISNGLIGTANLTLDVGSGAEIVSSTGTGVVGTDGTVGGVDNLNISGLVQGAIRSLFLRDGDDSVTLHAGADLVGNADGGLGTDTLTLEDSNSENVNFTNFENLVMNGTAWTLSGTSNFSTATTINSGTLTNSGSLTSPVTVGNGGTFANTATQTGAVMVAAGGAVSNSAPATITGDVTLGSGVVFDNLGTVAGNIYTATGTDFTNSNILVGAADIANGAVFANMGGMVGNVTVNNGGVFKGTGSTIGIVTNDGTFAPGASIGTHTITGNFVQNAGGTLEIEYDTSSADLVAISGTAALDGNVRFLGPAVGIVDGTTYTFLQAAGGISGTLTASDNQLLIDTSVLLGANTAQLVLNRIPVTSVARTTSAQAVALAVDQNLANNPGSAPALETYLNSLGDMDAVADVMETQTGMAGMAAVSAGMGMMRGNTAVALNRVHATEGARSAAALAGISPAAGGEDATAVRPGSFWMQGTRRNGDVSSDSHGIGHRYDATGLAFGADVKTANDTTVGLFGAFSSSHSRAGNGFLDRAKTFVKQLGIYGGKEKGPVHVNGMASFAGMNFKTLRPTGLGTAQADFSGTGVLSSAEVSYDLPTGGRLKLAPFIGIKGGFLHRDGYAETGAGALNLSASAETSSQFSSELGVGCSVTFVTPEKTGAEPLLITPSLRLSWVHEYLDQGQDVQARFSSTPAIVFNSRSPEQNRDSLHIKADVVLGTQEENKLNIFTSYEGALSRDAADHAFTVGVRYKW